MEFMSKIINLTKGLQTIVDDDDYIKLINYKIWTAEGDKGYFRAKIVIGKKTISLHRYLIEAKDGELVDHINGNPLDNRKENLRICDAKGNARNKKVYGKIPYKGVHLRIDNPKKPYRSCIKVDNKIKYLGYFETAQDAAKAYNEAAIKYFGEFAWLNKL